MAKYYKGNIIDVNSIPSSTFNFNIDEKNYRVLDDSSKELYSYFKEYFSDDIKKIDRNLKELCRDKLSKEDKKIYDEMFINAFKMNANNLEGTSIIYEKIYDEKGNAYGKELISGCVFPINSKYSEYDISYEEGSVRKVYYDKESGKVYSLESKYRAIAKFYLVDSSGEKYEISDRSHSELNVGIFTDAEHSIYFNNRSHRLFVRYPDCYTIKVSPKMIFSDDQRIECVIAGEKIANELEINNYIGKFSSGFGKRKRKREYIDKINDICFSNYLGDNVTFVTDVIKKERVTEEVMTKEMQELEFSLARLKSVSKDDYLRLNDEYQKVLNHDNKGLNLNPLAIKTIISLQSKVELAFICNGGNSKRIIEYLNKQANVYLEKYRYNSNVDIGLTITEIDKICENFLNSKSNYSYREQNEILRNVAMLYFFALYENKDILNSSKLENSYVLDNIKRIITVISVLSEENVIKPIPNTLYDIVSLDELLDFIKKIEFNIEEVKSNVLVKTL